MYPTRSKEAALPIERIELGYVQHTVYRQPDLYHEAVVELDSPFASVFAADTAVFAFLVLGDQNAGKSTFLHAFSYSEDANFLGLTSHLPILSASFVNSRFLVNSSRAPRDELPFLDTDIARGTFLLSLEDFFFFLNEHELPLEPVASTVRFALVQFIEIGGDHFDLLMHPASSTSPHVSEIVQKSRDLLRGSRKTIYFANCATLFLSSAASESPVLSPDALATLTARLSYLSAELPKGHEVLFYLSRPPPTVNLRASGEVVAQVTGVKIDLSADLSLRDFFRVLLTALTSHRGWSLVFSGVYEARHLKPDGSLDSDVLVQMVAQLFRHQMMEGEKGTEPIVVTHLLRCHRSLREHVDLDTGQMSLWLTPSVFADYLEDAHGTEVPESLLLQQFPIVAQRLAEGGLCIAHAQNNFSRLAITFQLDSSVLTWYPAGEVLQQPQPSQKSAIVIPTMPNVPRPPSEAQIIRFPIYTPLYDVIAFYFSNNVPASFWLTKESTMRIQVSGAIATRLSEVLRHLSEKEIPHHWSRFLSSPPEMRLSSASVVVWLLEEWWLGSRLLSTSINASHLEFPSVLHLPDECNAALKTVFASNPSPPPDSRPSVRIRLRPCAQS